MNYYFNCFIANTPTLNFYAVNIGKPSLILDLHYQLNFYSNSYREEMLLLKSHVENKHILGYNVKYP